MSAIIRSVLTPLIKLWLRSQVEAVANLDVEIAGKDGEILQGFIPSAKIKATGVIYQGLHLSNLALTSSQIHLNTPQVLKRESLKLLAPIQVHLDLQLTPQDLNHCLKASLLTTAMGRNLDNSANIPEVLEQILEQLGEEFQVQNLCYQNGLWQCQGLFTVRAT